MTECGNLVESYSATAPVRLEMTIPIVVHGTMTSDQASALPPARAPRLRRLLPSAPHYNCVAGVVQVFAAVEAGLETAWLRLYGVDVYNLVGYRCTTVWCLVCEP